jgi:glycerol-3-phosphate O-acyltransferase
MSFRLHTFFRWLLFLWVKVEVFPKDALPFELDSAQPVLYILADRGLSDLLVLSHTTDSRRLPNPLDSLSITPDDHYPSVYCVTSRNTMMEWLRRSNRQVNLLQDVLNAYGSSGQQDLLVVPVSVYWGRPLAKQKHWLQALFSDTWAVAGPTRKFFTLLIHGRSTRLIFSEPLSFQAIAQQNNHSAQNIQSFLTTQLLQQREATFGPLVTSHKVLTARVLETAIVQQTIEKMTLDGSASKASNLIKTVAKAKGYCNEMFADCSQISIDLMLRLLSIYWRRFYTGINIYNIETVKQTALTHQIVYVPCHRSHVDYLLLSYIIYIENLAIPYIAAGNNLNVPIIGRILRGGGAFFIRRSFKNNPLYASVVRAYIQQLMAQGTPLEYFIEGGRSRTGRMLKPKLGMLDMSIEGYMKTQARPLAFVPVYIGYEKLLEGNSYLGELYGEQKQSESLFGIVGAILRLKGSFGEVTTSFGRPIILDKLLDEKQPDWQQRITEIDQRPQWYRDMVATLGQRIMFGINRACVINPVNLIATIVLATPRQSIDIEALIEQSAFFTRMIHASSEASDFSTPKPVDLQQIERMAQQKLLHIRKHPLGDMVFLKPKDAILMGYYRNNSLHALIVPAMIACCFINTRQIEISRLTNIILLIYPFLQSELQLEWSDETLKPILLQTISTLVTEGVLIRSKDSLKRPERSDRSYTRLNRLGMVVQPILERYYMTFIVLWKSTEAPMNEAELEQRCHLIAQKISMLHGINSPDFFDRLLFRDFIKCMIKLNYLVKNAQGALVFSEGFELINLDTRSLLSIDVRNSILTLVSHH